MNTYTVTWKIQNLKAETPIDALRQAIEVIDDHSSTFDVTDEDTGYWRSHQDPRGYPREMWKDSVSHGETEQGYEDWVAFMTEDSK